MLAGLIFQAMVLGGFVSYSDWAGRLGYTNKWTKTLKNERKNYYKNETFHFNLIFLCNELVTYTRLIFTTLGWSWLPLCKEVSHDPCAVIGRALGPVPSVTGDILQFVILHLNCWGWFVIRVSQLVKGIKMRMIKKKKRILKKMKWKIFLATRHNLLIPEKNLT